MVRVEEITKDKAKYLKQAYLTPAQLAELGRARELGGAFAGRRSWETDQSLPVLRLVEEFGCNFQISDVIVLADKQGEPQAVLSIDDKWIGPNVEGATIYFGGKVHFF